MPTRGRSLPIAALHRSLSPQLLCAALSKLPGQNLLRVLVRNADSCRPSPSPAEPRLRPRVDAARPVDGVRTRGSVWLPDAPVQSGPQGLGCSSGVQPPRAVRVHIGIRSAVPRRWVGVGVRDPLGLASRAGVFTQWLGAVSLGLGGGLGRRAAVGPTAGAGGGALGSGMRGKLSRLSR